MALQTLTATSSDISPSSTSAKGSGNDGTNSGASLLGPDGATPLIPAFLLTALLAVGILAILYFRRRRAGPFAPQGDAAMGPLGGGFYFNRGFRAAGVTRFGMSGVGAGAGAGVDGREERRERPRMWDVYLDPMARKFSKDVDGCVRWMDMKACPSLHSKTFI